MGRRNYLVEGLSGTGKTSVATELGRRGYDVVHGDRELSYRGDPETGEPLEGFAHEHWIWDVEKVRAHVADQTEAITFFCGGSRNFDKFIDLFDAVFVLDVDLETLHRRLDARPDEEWGGGIPTDRSRIVEWHAPRPTYRGTASRSTPPPRSTKSSTTSSAAAGESREPVDSRVRCRIARRPFVVIESPATGGDDTTERTSS